MNVRMLLSALFLIVLTACDREPGPPPPTQPPPQSPSVVLKPPEALLTAALAPTTTDQIVSLPNRIAVTLPAATVTKSLTLSIREAASAPPSDAAALDVGDTLDLFVGEQGEFAKEITLEMPFDPQRVPPGVAPEQAVLVATLAPNGKYWVFVPTEIDAARNVVRVRTSHLSVWRKYYLKRGYDILGSKHFIIVFEPSLAVNAHVWQKTRDYIFEMESMLVNAYDKYAQAGFKMPSGQMFVFVEAKYAEPEWGKYSGHISIGASSSGTDPAAVKAELRQDLAHELFHAIENQYFVIQGMGLRYWWVEAAAEEAADGVAGVGAGEMIRPPKDYLSLPLNDSDQTHAYASAWFLKYLVDHGTPFKTMWDDVAARDLPKVIEPLEASVQRASGTSMDRHFRNFAQFLLFDPKSPMTLHRDLYYDATSARTELAADRGQASNAFTLKKDYSAQVWGIRAKFAPLKPQRFFMLKLAGELPPRTEAAVYLRKKEPTQPSGVILVNLLSGKSKAFAELSDGDTLFVLAVNTGGSEQTIGVELVETILTIVPASSDGGVEQRLDFTANLRNAPEGIAGLRYDWDFGDGATASGDYRPDAVRMSHAYAKDGTFTLTVALRAGESKQILAQGKAKVVIKAEGGLLTHREYYNNDPNRPYLIYTYRLDADQNEIIQGTLTRWHPNGNKAVEETYKNGKRNGPARSWHANGTLIDQMTYMDDEIDGTRTSWNENGSLTLQASYKKGVLHGPYTSYWSRWGVVQTQGNYVDGRQEGPWISTQYWQRDGRLLYYESQYKDGSAGESKFLYEKQVEEKK